MKITDLEIGQFATRNWYTNIKSLYVKRYNLNKYEYWEDGQFSSVASDNSLIFNYNDFKLCDCNGKLIEEFTYPMYFESIQNGTVIKFVSLHSGMVIIQGKANDKPGHEYPARVKHNDYSIWKPCDFSKAPEIDDLDYWDARFNAGLPVYYANKEGISSIIIAQKPSDYVKYQVKDTYKFHISGESKQKTEFTYPMYFESIKKNKAKQFIVKFTKICTGKVVKVSSQSIQKVGYVSSTWIAHTETKDWKQVNFDETVGKIIPTQDDIDELISDLKSIIEDNEEKHKQNVETLFGQNPIDEYVPNTEPSQYYLGVDYASQPDISFVQNEKDKSRLHNDALDAFSYAQWNYMQEITGATENVVNNLNKTKEFTMNNELKEAILELINENKQPKVKKPKTPKIVCNVNGDLMEFADEAALKSFMWSSRVESVIRYDLAGKVTVPFELSVEAPKTKASK